MLSYELTDFIYQDDTYNLFLELEINSIGENRGAGLFSPAEYEEVEIVVYDVNSVYKQLPFDMLQRCEVPYGIEAAIESFIRTNDDTYDDIINDYLEWSA